MGIDVYMHWKGQTEDERQAQFTGFSVVHGHVGYLREAYHGGPYATRVLVPEAWNWEEEVKHTCGANGKGAAKCEGCLGAPIPAATLRERLPTALAAAKERALAAYGDKLADDDPVLKSFLDFVELAERLEMEGKQPRINVSA